MQYKAIKILKRLSSYINMLIFNGSESKLIFQVFNYITKLVLDSKKAQQQKADEDKSHGGIKLDKTTKKKKKGCC